MNTRRIGIIDLVARGPSRTLSARVMNANMASIMPQSIAAWCAQDGHDVTFLCYTGVEDLARSMPDNIDIVFIGAFTEAALAAYALSNFFRSRGAVTVLGGPHARCYPEDAVKYFDYVLGLTDHQTIRDVLDDCAPHRPRGVALSAADQPSSLPSVRERWPFIEETLSKTRVFKVVPMIGSFGCPYRCPFCIDAAMKYQPLDFDALQEDLRFLLTKFKRPGVVWHDPNFGVRFDEYLDMIEEAVPPGRMRFIAESSLSILSEPHLKRLQHNGFKAMLPGIESWFSLGNKSKTGGNQGMDKVKQVSEHVNLILKYIPYVQTNFVLGLDCDEGPEPFELTKRFLDMTPGAFPGYSLLTAFGRAAELNLQYQRDGRVLPFPFHFLNNNQSMNVLPRNYAWEEFYDHVIDLTSYSFSWRSIARRFRGTSGGLSSMTPRLMNVIRAVSTEGFGRIKYHREIRRRLAADPHLRQYFARERIDLPTFYAEIVRNDLGWLWDYLPARAINHDPYAYLAAEETKDRSKSHDSLLGRGGDRSRIVAGVPITVGASANGSEDQPRAGV